MKSLDFRDLRAQYAALRNDIDCAIADALAEGRFISGPQVSELECELAGYVGVKHCITCGNGTDALQLALLAWGVGPGDAVFVPDFTFFSSGEVVSAVGATPVFVDVDERSFNLNPERLENAILSLKKFGELTPKAVIAVDLFGLPADYQRICKVCTDNNLLLLEDGAQGFGGSIGGRMACSFGDISTTSFFPAKPLGCYGDGGAVFTDDDGWAELIRSFAVHGKGSMKYDNIRIGMNSRLDTIQAAILQVKLKAFRDYELEAVNQVAEWYDELLKDAGLVLPMRYQGFTSSWAQYTVQAHDMNERSALQAYLKQLGIPSMVYYPKPMHQQQAFASKCIESSGSVTEHLCETVLSLPLGPYMKRDDVQCVAGAIIQYLEE